MYLYYLIGWKLDANQEMEVSGVSQKLEKEKCFILALDGDVDFDQGWAPGRVFAGTGRPGQESRLRIF